MPDYDLWAEKICHIFLARPARHLGPPTEPGHTALWLEPQDLPTLLESPGDRAFAARLLGLG
jgi:8-oxo-dGTP diphosphatase